MDDAAIFIQSSLAAIDSNHLLTSIAERSSVAPGVWPQRSSTAIAISFIAGLRWSFHLSNLSRNTLVSLMKIPWPTVLRRITSKFYRA